MLDVKTVKQSVDWFAGHREPLPPVLLERRWSARHELTLHPRHADSAAAPAGGGRHRGLRARPAAPSPRRATTASRPTARLAEGAAWLVLLGLLALDALALSEGAPGHFVVGHWFASGEFSVPVSFILDG